MQLGVFFPMKADCSCGNHRATVLSVWFKQLSNAP